MTFDMQLPLAVKDDSVGLQPTTTAPFIVARLLASPAHKS